MMENITKKMVLLVVLLLLCLNCGEQKGGAETFVFPKFEKYTDNPIISGSGSGFDADLTFNPGVIFDNGSFYMLYRAIDLSERPTDGCWATSRIGLAVSKDGVNFERYSDPVIVPEFAYELQGGCEDPRLLKIGDTYYVTYTGYSPSGAPSCLASSKDMIHWNKFGPIVPYKSAAILNVPINGEYWLYFGDTNIWAAHSTDFIHWDVVEEPVMGPREGYFDEELVEPGPPPIMTDDGILLIYNGNISGERAKEIGEKEGREMERQYSTGWALFSKEDPTKLITRSNEPFLRPTEDFEKFGQVNDVVLAEGLAKKGSKWYLYFGCADKYIGVSIADETIIGKGIQQFQRTVLGPQGKDFESERVYNPAVIRDGDTLVMVYRAEGKNTGTGVLCLASSANGVHYERYINNPVIRPDKGYDINGCEDPRMAKFNDTYYLFYNGNGGRPGNICVATSRDLKNWQKQGEILQPKNEWEISQIKAGAIVPERINGKYWMYYMGEKEPWKTKMGLAYSEDLIHWVQLDNPVMEPRKEVWDSQGTEPGCAVVLPEGILVVYNGWDGTTQNKGGWALFSKEDPTKLIKRCKEPIVSLPEEHVFVTALEQFKNRWYLYWGANDEWIDG